MGDTIDIDYKEKYFKLLKKLDLLHARLTCDRCPVFKQCCAGCLEVRDLVKRERKDG